MRVLLVEDDDDIRVVVRLSLEQLGGWQVTEAPSGAAALQTLGQAAFDVVLLDVMMPGIDGPRTLEQLRALPSGPDLPVIFLTAKAMPSEVERLISLGALGVITKPFDPMGLVDRIGALMDGRPSPAREMPQPGGVDGDTEVDAGALRRLDGLEGESGGELVDELIDLFAGSAPGSIEALRAACAAEDHVTATRIAHTLKSSAATLGACGLAAIAAEIEAVCARGSTAGTSERVQRLTRALGEVLSRIRAAR